MKRPNWQRLFAEGLPGHLIALASGALATLSFAPFQWWICGILSALGFLACTLQLDGKKALWRGWWFGLGFNTAGVSWVYVSIHVYGYAPVPLAITLTLAFTAGLAFFSALHAWVFAKIRLSNPNTLLAVFVLFPASWVLMEWFRSWFLTGFPWLYLGYAHIETPLAGWAPVGGIFLVSYFVAMTAAGFYWLIANAKDWQTKTALPALALIMAPWLIGAIIKPIEWTHSVGSLKVAAIQGNIPQEIKWNRDQLRPTLDLYQKHSQENADADLIIWPETAIPAFYHRAKDYLSYLDKQAKDNNTALLTGIPYRDPDAELVTNHNSVVGVGLAEGLYHKQKLVPFGEYVPLEELLRGLIQFFDLPMSSFRSGGAEQSLITATLTGQSYAIANYICYEIVYPDFVANLARDAELLVTISNDAWFGASIGPHQHLEMAQMRALENGRDLVRGTNNGISAIVNHRGQALATTPQNEEITLRGEVSLRQGMTPYMRWQSYPVYGLVMLSFFLCFFYRRHTATAPS